QRQPAPIARLEPAPPAKVTADNSALDDLLQALDRRSTDVPRNDAMPANPADDAPLTDPGFTDAGPVRNALEAKTGPRKPRVAAAIEPTAAPVFSAKPAFDPDAVERPPQPRSSFATTGRDPFAPEPERDLAQVQAEMPLNQTSTSTFVAAARRAQRAKQDSQASASDTNSLI